MDWELVSGDCVEELYRFKDVALYATSPPYAQGLEYELGLGYEGLWGLMEDVAHASFHGAKPGGFFWANFGETTKYPKTMAELYNETFAKAGWVMHSRRVWVKKFARCSLTGSMINRTVPAAEFEHLWTWRKPPMTKEVHRDKKLSLRGVWTCDEDVDVSREEHPAAYPAELPEKAIRVWTDEGDLVVDPFCGSGSTGVACVRTNRNFIGIDMNEQYLQIAKDRIEWAQRGLKRPKGLPEDEKQTQLFEED